MKNFHNKIAMTLLAALFIGAVSSARAAEAASSQQLIDINTATQAELETLPGVGPSKARAVIEFRTRRPFKRAEDIMKVKGIGRKSFLKMKPYLTVSGKTQIPQKSAKK
jgi:competence protein ComEA